MIRFTKTCYTTNQDWKNTHATRNCTRISQKVKVRLVPPTPPNQPIKSYLKWCGNVFGHAFGGASSLELLALLDAVPMAHALPQDLSAFAEERLLGYFRFCIPGFEDNDVQLDWSHLLLSVRQVCLFVSLFSFFSHQMDVKAKNGFVGYSLCAIPSEQVFCFSIVVLDFACHTHPQSRAMDRMLGRAEENLLEGDLSRLPRRHQEHLYSWRLGQKMLYVSCQDNTSCWIAWSSILTSWRTKHSKCSWKRPSQKFWFKLAYILSTAQVFAPQSPLILRISTGGLALLPGCWNISAEAKGNLAAVKVVFFDRYFWQNSWGSYR